MKSLKLLTGLCSSIFCFFGNAEQKKISLDEIYAKQSNLSKEEVEQVFAIANSGDGDYQLVAGIIYASGTTVEPDMKKAIEWWEKSAKSGNSKALRYVAIQYATGENVPLNYKKAFEYYQKAAKLGDSHSMCNLGIMYELGQHVDKDLSMAIKYYQKAADSGLPQANVLLADMYFAGHGIPMDRKKACQLYKQALTSKDASTLDLPTIYGMLGQAYTEPLGESGLTNEEAVYFLKKAFELGNSASIQFFVLAKDLRNEKNDEWVFRTASNYCADPNCLFALGVCYEFGYGTKQDAKKAFECYQKSAELGSSWGMHHLAYAYFSGLGVEKNLKKGFKWELMAAEKVPQAQFNVGVSYLHGQGVQKNRQEAKKWLLRASKNYYTAADEVLKGMRD